jgi:hypothetical protein
MFEEAVQGAKGIFRVRRGQQQFPRLPFLFGGYDLPEKKLTFFQKLGQEEVLSETKRLYSGMLKWMVEGDERGKEGVSSELRLQIEACMSLFAKRRIKLVAKMTERNSTFSLIARRQYNGPFLPIKRLNPHTENLITLFKSAVLNAQNPVYADLQVKHGNDLQRDVDYLLARFHPTEILEQLQRGEALSPFQQEQLHLLHLHINRIGVSYDEALVAIQGDQRLLVVNEQKEELDGEMEPNVHIVLVRKMTALSKCVWLERYFPQNCWVLSDLDFVLEASSLSP